MERIAQFVSSLKNLLGKISQEGEEWDIMLSLESTCSTCGGSGYVEHPCWEEYYRARREDRQLADALAETAFTGEQDAVISGWFRSQCDLDEWPPAEIVCTKCGGSGRVQKRIPLLATLKSIDWEE